MNVREIERQLGIPRANVRYYEKEGLLHPQRGSNNYRIYTGEDIEALKKIRLLRQLDMPIETIRAVQAGEVALTDAVARQERLLENEAVKLEQARAVCRSMLADGVTYAALEPARYEQARPALPGQAGSEPARTRRPPVEGAEWAFNPWQRFWARFLDVHLATGAAAVFLSLACHITAAAGDSRTAGVFSLVLGWMLVLAIEPLLLSTWGTTPGKWLLGLELRDHAGGKLSYMEGLRRTWGVLGTGYGFEIPVYSLYRLYKSYRTCADDEEMPYDREQGFQYYSIVPGQWWYRRASAAAALLALLVWAEVWCSYQGLAPPNRGDITKAELAENINALANRLDHGLWVDGDGYELARQTADVLEADGSWVRYVYGEPVSDKPVYTVETDENGYITAVTVMEEGGFEGEGASFSTLHLNRAELVTMAFIGTSGSGYRMGKSALWRDLSQAGQWDGSPVSGEGFTRTATLEQEGYYDDFGQSTGLLMPLPEAESGRFRFTVRVEKTTR
ncbi:MAG: MerR family transcriptional regulator [Oscillibacter sp.]|nr:MerR family transcriptional regulator [Oscillibacter sp.]